MIAKLGHNNRDMTLALILNRTTQIGQFEQFSLDKSGWTGHPGQVRLDRSAWTVQPGQVSQNKTERMGC
jgi:hypothetical protein